MLAFAPGLVVVVLAATLARGDTVLLASGKRLTSGAISPTLRWQSSGTLLKGGCPKYVGIPGQCFTLNLLAKGQLERKSFVSPPSTGIYDITNLNDADDESTVFTDVEAELLDEEDPAGQENFDVEDLEQGIEEIPGGLEKRDSARQRIELFSWPPAHSGQTFMYRWAYYLAPVSTSTRFFHIAQLIRRNPATPVVTLNAVNGRVFFSAPGIKGSKGSSDSVPLQRFVGLTTQHIVRVKYGSRGNIRWIVKDVKSGKTIMSYHASGNLGSNGSIKFGLYRRYANGMKRARAFAGGYSSKRLN